MKLPTYTSTKIFGTTCALEQASVIIIPVPWEVTVSSRSGTSLGPESVLKASYELKDLGEYADMHTTMQDLNVAMLPIPYDWKTLSDTLRQDTIGYIHAMESGFERSILKKGIVKTMDHYAYQLKEAVKAKSLAYLREDKLVGVLGGDHSVPLGCIEALAELYHNVGILQIDAHPGLHKAYRGFHYSHASIMYNALQLPHVTRLVQVGLRHCSLQELQVIKAEEGRIFPFFDSDLKRQHLRGSTWDTICKDIVETLPDKLYVSFDIDGLDARLCPSTGTPVPGGLEFDEVVYLLEQIVQAGKQIVGFDLCEVAPGENMDWDARIGSRMLYKLVQMAKASQSTR